MSDLDKGREFPATVAKIVDEFTLVINRGRADGVSKGDLFLVYYTEDDDIIDPDTGESLGNLEVVRGVGKVVHLQEKMSTIKSTRKAARGKTIRKLAPKGLLGMAMAGDFKEEIIEEPEQGLLEFDDPNIKDKAKPV
ncbi:hypothetical protein [Halomonas sp. YLGW01]|uniref:hypothetical protein n=1 Tax=Halomonas sp. YLGW01 TaxID=2773308 RepID=UPI0017823ED1|nr:hypothetical protein [Halomonas sp. YLGW01]